MASPPLSTKTPSSWPSIVITIAGPCMGAKDPTMSRFAPLMDDVRGAGRVHRRAQRLRVERVRDGRRRAQRAQGVLSGGRSGQGRDLMAGLDQRAHERDANCAGSAGDEPVVHAQAQLSHRDRRRARR